MTTSPDATLPELPEASATGSLAAIYAELRALTGTPVVALIFRHLATHPGLLEEIWESLRPLMTSGVLQETAWRIASQSVPPGLVPPIGRDAQMAIGLEPAALPPILNAIDAYNRANPVNLLIMLSLLQRIKSDAAVRAVHAVPTKTVPANPWAPPAPVPQPLSRMISPAGMAPPIRRLVNDIGFGDRRALDAVVPSLLRHLAGTPGLLAIVHTILNPRLHDGSLRTATDALHAQMQAAAQELAGCIGPLPRLAAMPAPVATMRTFTDSWIPLMTIVGTALGRALRA